MWKKLIKMLQENKDKIYYSIILIFFVLAVVYGVKGYFHHQSIHAVKDGNDLIGRIFSPFILAVLRFVLVVLLGIFVAMIVIATPLKRIKVMQFEVEFAEIAKQQEKQLNQFHFISSVLKLNTYFIGRVSSFSPVPYERTIQEILAKYEEFFQNELLINIQAQVWEYQAGTSPFSNPYYTNVMDRLVLETSSDKQVFIKNKVSVDTNILMAVREEFGKKVIVLIESKEHTFTDYDKEVVISIFEYGKNICHTTLLIP